MIHLKSFEVAEVDEVGEVAEAVGVGEEVVADGALKAEEEDGGDNKGVIDIDLHQDLYGIVHGTGLEVHVKEDALV